MNGMEISIHFKFFHVDGFPQERCQTSRPDWSDKLPDVPQQDRGGGALRRPLLRHLLWDSPGRSRTLLIYRAILITKYILSERHPRRL